MKKIKLFILVFILASNLMSSQTAVNFNVNDCSGVNHDLFTELDACKVIVLVWVMPCATCISPALAAYSTVKSYSISNPEVIYYLVDDFGNTSCSTLSSWASTNGLGNVNKFSNAAIKQSDYGATGMPHVLVLGGKNHKVFDNQRDVFDLNILKQAIDAALQGNASTVTELNETMLNKDKEIVVYPNPVSNQLNLKNIQTENLRIDIYNQTGSLVKTELASANAIQKNEIEIKIEEDLANGIYFVRIKMVLN